MGVFWKLSNNIVHFLEILNPKFRIRPYLEILKLRGSLVDLSIVLAVCGAVGEIDVRALGAFLCSVLVHSACDIINDIYDIDIDRIAKPSSPLVTGEISVPVAWTYMGALLAIAFATAYALSTILLAALILGFIVGGITYSHPLFRLKDKPFYSMLFTTGFGFAALGVWSIYEEINTVAILLSNHIFFTIFCLVSLKDYKDIEGDRNSLPLRYGIPAAVRINTALALLPLASYALLLYFMPSVPLLLSLSVYVVLLGRCLYILWTDPIGKGKKLRERMILAIVVPNVAIGCSLAA